MHLLLAAGGIEIDHLHDQGIVEKGHVRVVEGEVPVFADSQEHDIGRHPFEQLGVTTALGLGIGGLRIHAVHRVEPHLGEDPLTEELAEGLGRLGRNPDVFVHMEGIDTPPVDLGVREKRRQKLVLRRSGGEYDIHLPFAGEQRTEMGGNVAGGRLTELRPGIGPLDLQPSLCKFGYHVKFF